MYSEWLKKQLILVSLVSSVLFNEFQTNTCHSLTWSSLKSVSKRLSCKHCVRRPSWRVQNSSKVLSVSSSCTRRRSTAVTLINLSGHSRAERGSPGRLMQLRSVSPCREADSRSSLSTLYSVLCWEGLTQIRWAAKQRERTVGYNETIGKKWILNSDVFIQINERNSGNTIHYTMESINAGGGIK